MAGPHKWIAQVPSAWQASSFDTTALPASNEVVVFDGTGQGDVLGGSQAAVDLDLLRIDQNYHGSIGAHGNPLIISADTVIHTGTGSLYYENGNGLTDLMIIESPNGVDAAFLGGDIDRLRCLQGYTTILPTIGAMTRIELAIGDAGIDPTLFIAPGVPDEFLTGTLFMDGGYCVGPLPHNTAVPASANVIMFGGYWLITRSPSLMAFDKFVIGGGNVEVKLAGSTAGSVRQWSGEFELINGTFDFRPTPLMQLSTVYMSSYFNLLKPADTSLFTIQTEARMKP